MGSMGRSDLVALASRRDLSGKSLPYRSAFSRRLLLEPALARR